MSEWKEKFIKLWQNTPTSKVGDECRFLLNLLTFSKIYVIIDT